MRSNLKINISEITLSYWTKEDFAELNAATSPKEMLPIAMRIIDKMPDPIVQVCGPIGTGGLGNVTANLVAFNTNILFLQKKGLSVFDQMPFEEPIQKLKERLHSGHYLSEILTDFYLPLFKSGRIKTLYFMKGWETSYGARWEYDTAKILGMDIVYF